MSNYDVSKRSLIRFMCNSKNRSLWALGQRINDSTSIVQRIMGDDLDDLLDEVEDQFFKGPPQKLTTAKQEGSTGL